MTTINAAFSIDIKNYLTGGVIGLTGQPWFSTGPGTVTHLSCKSMTPSKSVSKATPAPSTLAPTGVSSCLSQSSQIPSLSASPFYKPLRPHSCYLEHLIYNTFLVVDHATSNEIDAFLTLKKFLM